MAGRRTPLLVAAAVAAGVLLLVAIFPPKPTVRTASSGKLRVVTSFLPIYVFTANVVGDAAEVRNLLPNGVGPHEYSATPSDVRMLADADVLVVNGLDLEDWMDDLIKQAGGKVTVIEASKGLLKEEEGVDPHVWTDPVYAAEMVGKIAERLAAVDPKNAEVYRRNSYVYQRRLKTLDNEYQAALGALKRKDFIAFHPAFGYLAKRYGLDQRAVIEESPGKEPSARYLADIIDIIRREKVRALFSEPQFTPKVVETVASETGLTIRELDTLETGVFAPDTYEAVMRKDLRNIVEALSE